MRDAELRGATFRCLEGCGFCCTFPPEATKRELALLRARVAPRALPVTVGDGRTYLGLQGGCGACTLLERRGCQTYDLRPAHCRYFPFHLHFAEEPEVYVNYTCRGVEAAPSGDLTQPFQAQVLANAKPEEIERHERLARETYAEFKRRARRAGAWGDADAAAAKALETGAALFTRDGVRALCQAASLEPDVDALHRDALEPFGAADVTQRPFYLAPDLRWITFARAGPGTLDVLEMDEKGSLARIGGVDGIGGWEDLAPPIADALATYLRRLTTRRVFAGSVYAIVDDEDYQVSVEDAARERVAHLVVDLALRARILVALGTTDAALADEVARFYDSTFLDAPTIGGFL